MRLKYCVGKNKVQGDVGHCSGGRSAGDGRETSARRWDAFTGRLGAEEGLGLEIASSSDPQQQARCLHANNLCDLYFTFTHTHTHTHTHTQQPSSTSMC